MLNVKLRNLLLGWPDPVAGAKVYVDPAGQVYPAPAVDRETAVTTGSSGEAKVPMTGVAAGSHALWIVPKNSSPDTVGTATAKGMEVDRIFRGLRLVINVDSQQRVTQATVHSCTNGNGTATLTGATGKDQTLDVRLRPMWIKSPYHYKRKEKIDMIVVHKTGGDVIGPAINQMLVGGASAHYIVDRDGSILKMVKDEEAAGHASHENSQDQSHWGKQTGLSWRSIGIENVGTVKQNFTDPQYNALIGLIHDLMKTHGVLRHRVIGHSDILTDGQGALSDDRIACPGYQFEWIRLENAKPAAGMARSGGAPVADVVGPLFEALSRKRSKELRLVENDHDPVIVNGKVTGPGRFGGQPDKDVTDGPIKQLQTWLLEIGYSVGKADGVLNHRTIRAARHFQVHFQNTANRESINAETAALIKAVRMANPVAD